MLENYAQGLAQTLHAHPNWGLALAFFVAFVESLAVIGTIVPGSVTMTAIGILVGTGVMPATLTFVTAIVGALTGDLLSYWFGKYYDQRLKNMWPFTTHPQWITAGELFFEKHGGKSVIIGRFFGPVRSFVPLIAGLLQMHPLYFLLAAIPSATLWALVYMTPGILLGALSVELPPRVAGKFLLYLFLGLVVLWCLIWLVKFIIKKFWGAIDQSISRLWQAMRARKAWHFITTPLADPREPNLHEQLMLVFGAIVAFILSLVFLWNITHHGILTAWNQPVHDFLQSIRVPFVDKIMTLFTLLGDRKCILSFSVAVLCWLSWQRQWRAAAHWLVLMILVIGTALTIKWGYYSPRPMMDMPSNSTSSLPSGHTIFTLAFFGFLSVLIGHELPRRQKKYCYKIAITMVFLAAFSRIYLGPHWLTDIISSFLLGLVCVLVVTISYRRHLTTHINPKKLAIASGCLLLILWTGYSIIRYNETYDFHRPHIPSIELASAQWWQQNNNAIPFLRLNRFGNPAEPLNVQWVGSIKPIQQLLEKRGWQNHSIHHDLKGTLERLSLQDPNRRLPFFSVLYHDHKPILIMTKLNAENRYDAVFYLWKSDVTLLNTQTPFWIGTVKKYIVKHEALLHRNNIKDDIFSDALDLLIQDTRDINTSIITLPSEKLSKAPAAWKWSGRILQLQEQ